MGKSYGFIEISGVVAAVDALDIMCKTAEVELVTWERTAGDNRGTGRRFLCHTGSRGRTHRRYQETSGLWCDCKPPRGNRQADENQRQPVPQ